MLVHLRGDRSWRLVCRHERRDAEGSNPAGSGKAGRLGKDMTVETVVKSRSARPSRPTNDGPIDATIGIQALARGTAAQSCDDPERGSEGQADRAQRGVAGIGEPVDKPCSPASPIRERHWRVGQARAVHRPGGQ